MPSRLEIKTGIIFGRLTIIKELESRNNQRFFLCKCDCGNLKEIRLSKIKSGEIKTCGCLRKTNAVKHGDSYSRLYGIWNQMHQRCENKNRPNYKYYGGRGLSVCSEWKDYKIFKKWALSNGYLENLTIERVDNNNGYSPENCIFADSKTQANNKRWTIEVDYNGKKYKLSELAEKTGKNINVLRYRVKAGWDIEDVINKPIIKNKKE